MASFKRFEDIQGWQKARELVRLVYKRVQRADERRDWNFAKQFTSAALSVMNNIAEGFGRMGDKEFIRFLIIARGSAIEVQSMTYSAEDLAYITPAERIELYDLAGEALKLIGGLIRFLEGGQQS